MSNILYCQRIRRCVLEKTWFVISVLFGAALALAFGTNCGSDEPFPAFPQASGAYVAVDDAMAVNSLCVVGSEEASSAELGKIFLQPRDSKNPCEESADLSFVITRDEPKVVVLEGKSYTEYCIGVKRLSGYITISHPRGIVTRDGDFFTWCVAKQPKYPDYMIVRSLTARAEFELLVP